MSKGAEPCIDNASTCGQDGGGARGWRDGGLLPWPMPLFFCPFAVLGLLGQSFDASVGAQAIASFPVLARWAARLASLAVYAAAALWLCSGRPLAAGRRGGPSVVLAAACAALVLGVGLTLYARLSLPAFVAVQVVSGLGQALNLLAWAEAACAASPRGSRWKAVILAGGGACAVSLAFKLLGGPASRAVLLAAAVGSCAVLLPERGAKSAAGEGPRRAGAAAPAGAVGAAGAARRLSACLRSLGWGLVLLMACYALMYRVIGAIDQAAGPVTPVLRFVVTCTALAAMWAFLARREGGADAVLLPLLVLLVAALMSVPASSEGLRAVSSAVAASCWPLFYYALWAVLLDERAPEGAGAASMLAAGWLVLNVLLIVLAPLAFALVKQVGQGTLSMLALSVMLAYTAGVATLLARRRADDDRMAARNELRPDFGQLVESVAREHRLTPRERDVLELLARGRSAPFIAESLSISLSTTKGHIKHVYAKLGVSGKQELLSLLERAAQGGPSGAGED